MVSAEDTVPAPEANPVRVAAIVLALVHHLLVGDPVSAISSVLIPVGALMTGEVRVLFVIVCAVVLSTVTAVLMAIEAPVTVIPVPEVGLLPDWTQVPGVPNTVQMKILQVWSITKS